MFQANGWYASVSGIMSLIEALNSIILIYRLNFADHQAEQRRSLHTIVIRAHEMRAVPLS
jgi:hypothetical protein